MTAPARVAQRDAAAPGGIARRRGLRFPLRAKFFVFAALISVAPLIAVGQSLMRIAQDELKSAANEALAEAASQLAGQIDATVDGVWLRPLALVGRAVDDSLLDVRQKVGVLNLAAREIPGVVALQLTVDGSPLPVMAIAEAHAIPIAAAGLDPARALRTPPETLARIVSGGRPVAEWRPDLGRWLATVAFPLETTLSGRALIFSARIDLAALARMADAHPLGRRGELTVIDAFGAAVLRPAPPGLEGRAIMAEAAAIAGGSARAAVVRSYTRADGAQVLAAYAATDAFPWAVVAELTEASAYAAIAEMIRSLGMWAVAGLVVATIAASFAAWRLIGPVLAITTAAARIGGGDFSVRVAPATRDEIGDLAERVNVMARELAERFELMKFVSRETVKAIGAADASGVQLGGARRAAAMLFSDIRGYTAFAETADPEVVVEMLNGYLDAQARVVAEHGGDVDKFIGDEVVAVFLGENRIRNAASCAVAIQAAMPALLAAHPDWDLHVGVGVNAGDVVMGATGARDRMDFTVLGGAVNLAARLCAAAPPDAVLVSASVAEALNGDPAFRLQSLPLLTLKGIAKPVPVWRLS